MQPFFRQLQILFSDFAGLNQFCCHKKPQSQLKMKTENRNKIIRTGGVFSGLFLMLHIGFYWLLNWRSTLQVMNHEDRSILLTLNLVVILFLIYATSVSFLLTKQLPQTSTGRSILLFFALFYLLRIVAEFIIFGFVISESPIILLFCLIPAICYGLAVLQKPTKMKPNEEHFK